MPALFRTLCRHTTSWPLLVGGTLALLGANQSARAQSSGDQPPAPQITHDHPAGSAAIPSAASDVDIQTGDPAWRQTLLGAAAGLRPWLARSALSIGLIDSEELLANATGGTRRGVTEDGLTMLSVGLDTGAAFGWHGGTVNVSVLQIRGRSLSQDNLAGASNGIIDLASGNEAEPSTRLWEAWFDQANASGTLDLKIGQQSLDQEFLTGTYTALFVNAGAGWPAAPSADLYGGGPAYPLAVLGVRLRGTLGPLTGQIGVFDDNPSGGSFDADDQRRGAERSGTLFSLQTGALIIGELQYNRPAGLAGTYRVGAMYDTGLFPDQRVDENGVLLADPASDGQPAQRHGNWEVYASFDQSVWQKDNRSLGLFLRMEGAPASRNLVSFSANLGLALAAPFAARPHDTFGIEYGIARISGGASAEDAERRVLGGDPAYPIRSSENFVEATYQAQIRPWWSLQPDLQYVFTPGGGVPDPSSQNSSIRRIGNEAIFDLRAVVTF